jgi:hypothetical protein
MLADMTSHVNTLSLQKEQEAAAQARPTRC